jgi:hypothetical protein
MTTLSPLFSALQSPPLMAGPTPPPPPPPGGLATTNRNSNHFQGLSLAPNTATSIVLGADAAVGRTTYHTLIALW